jgi:hypothetical protein
VWVLTFGDNMEEFQSAEESRKQTDGYSVSVVKEKISTAIKKGELNVEVNVEFLTNDVINKLTAAGYRVGTGRTVLTKIISWA